MAAGHYARLDLGLYALLWRLTKANPSSQSTEQHHAEEPVQALQAASMGASTQLERITCHSDLAPHSMLQVICSNTRFFPII